jgi:hypothetical protein
MIIVNTLTPAVLRHAHQTRTTARRRTGAARVERLPDRAPAGENDTAMVITTAVGSPVADPY